MRQMAGHDFGPPAVDHSVDIAALIRRMDWSKSALGPREQWPQSLQTSLSICLGSSAAMVITWGPSRVQLYNEAYRAVWHGSQVPLAVGATAEENWRPRWTLLKPLLDRVFSDQPTAPHAYTVLLPDGDGQPTPTQIVEEHCAIVGEGGQVVGVLTTLTLATEARARERAELPRKLTRLLLEKSPVALAIVSGPEHRYVVANPRYLEMVNKQDIIGKPVAEVFPELVGTPLMEEFDRVYQTGETFISEEYSTRLERGSGVPETCFFRFNLVAIRDSAGVVDGFMCSAVEITDQVRARRDAEAASKLLATVIDEMHTGMIVAEAPSGRTLFANRAVERTLGPPPRADLTASNYRGYQFFGGNGRAWTAHEYPIARVLRGERLIDEEVKVIDGHGNLRTVCVSATPVHDDEGERMAAVVAFYDITDRIDAETQRRELLLQAEQARAQAEQASRAKDEFMAILGHELRNPLAPITTALYLMERQGDHRNLRERTIIQRQVDHLVRLVDDLLDASRVTGGKVRLKKRPVEAAAIVAKALETSGPLLEERAHRLRVEVPDSGLAVFGDLERLAQVVANLLTNAAKYTPKGGRVTVDARREGDNVAICVRDTGIGVSPDMLPRIFEMFVQEPQALDRSRGGLGLGLSIVHGLVLLHGGTVSAHSEGDDQGSAFVVRLPLARASDVEDPAPLPASRRSIPAAPEAPLAPHRILVVDDNEDAAATLGFALEELGQHVRVAHDGPSALRIAEEFLPDLGLLDIGLPVMDGYELAGRMRSLLELARVRLVAVTGYGQASDRARAFAAGFDAHVVKPLPIDVLESILADLDAERERVDRG